MRDRFRSVLPFLVLLVCGACGSMTLYPEPDANWREAEVESPSDRVLWKIILLQVERLGYPITGGLDPSSGEIRTGWRTNLQPFSSKGHRERAEVHMKPVEKGLWTVSTRVQRQINKALADPLDPSRAEWEWDAEDVVGAEILLRHVVSAMSPQLEVDEEEDEFEKLMKDLEKKAGR